MRRKACNGAFAAIAIAGLTPMAIAANVNVVTIVDESTSTSAKHTWLGGMVTTLDATLKALNPAVGPNRYGLVGFGAQAPHERLGHAHDLDGGTAGVQAFDSASQFGAATGSLVRLGSQEDGWSGIATANRYEFDADAARNYILVTDENRDAIQTGLTYDSILQSMTTTDTLLNAVVNARFACADGRAALGIDAKGNGYVADGAGSSNRCTGATAVSGAQTTIADYVDLALATGGAAWDLNFLDSGGLIATSFTQAFIDIKVQEIVDQTTVIGSVPEPGVLALASLGLLGLGAMRYRKS